MNTAMSQQELADLLDQAVRKVTEQTAGIQLSPSGETLGETCVPYTSPSAEDFTPA